MTGIDVGISEPADVDPPDPEPRASTTTHQRPDDVGDERAAHRSGRRRRSKVSKWDRPPPPHDWRWYVGMLGRTLIAVGILMFGFVAYQLWGTAIENAAAQRALEDDFEELLAQFEPIDVATLDDPVVVAPAETGDAAPSDPVDDGTATPAEDGATETEPDDDGADDGATGALADDAAGDDPGVIAAADANPTAVVPVAEQNLPLVEDGEAIARIEIPRIGVNDIVVAGVNTSDLKRGPGHFPDTPLPGQLGNAAIAGHRTTYGAPFFEVDQLEPGDEIRVTTLNGVFVYRVTGQEIVAPSAYRVIATTDPTVATLTLVSCHPTYTARERIIISAALDTEASGAVGEPVLNYGRPDETEVATDEVAQELPGEDVDVAEATPQAPAVDEAPAANDESPADGDTTGSLAVEAATPDELLAVGVDEESADVFGKGWFSDPAANPHVGFWGLVLTMIAVLSYLLSRRLRRDWVGALVGFVPFIVTLYFFFQNVNRLLPPNL